MIPIGRKQKPLLARLTIQGSRQACTLFFFLVSIQATALADQRYSEGALRAAMLLNLPKFISWPATAGNPEKACIIAASDVDAAISELIEKSKTGGRRISLTVSTEISDDCSYVYLGSGANIPPDSAKHLLIINAGGDERRALIELVRRGERIVIRLDHAGLIEGGYTVDARLLQLAEDIGER